METQGKFISCKLNFDIATKSQTDFHFLLSFFLFSPASFAVACVSFVARKIVRVMKIDLKKKITKQKKHINIK